MTRKHDKAIAIIATLDTKGPEAAFVKSCIENAGYTTMVLDTGILDRKDPAAPHPDFSGDEIAREGGNTGENWSHGVPRRIPAIGESGPCPKDLPES